jgi:hypothetical protein
MYEIAQQYHAKCIRHEAPFFFRKDDPDMQFDLYFTTFDNAGGFIATLGELNRFGCVRNRATYTREPEHVMMPHSGMDFVFRLDYDTGVNPLSPMIQLPDICLESVQLNDERRMQMFEQYGSSDPRIRRGA